MKKYLESNKVKVFPSAFRSYTGNPDSFITTEETLRDLGNRITNVKKNYIIDEGDGKVSIVLGGYLFKGILINDILGLFDSSSTIYAGIKLKDLDSSYTSVKFPTLIDFESDNHFIDSSGHFVALAFSNDVSDFALASYYIPVIDNGVLCASSKLNISSSQVENSNGKSIQEEITTGKISASSDITLSGLGEGESTNYSVTINGSGKLFKNNLSTNSPNKNGLSLEFIDTISSTSDGKITATKKGIEILGSGTGTGESGTAGVIKINNASYSTVKGIDFSPLNLESNKTIKSISQKNGVISASSQDISIASSQINDKTNSYNGDSEVVVTGKAIKNAIDGLDVSSISGFGAGKTLSALSETDGKISATFQDISITSSQITDIGTTIDNKINALDVPTILGTQSKTLASLTETDGKISATFYDIELGAGAITSGTLDGERIPYASQNSKGGIRMSFQNGVLYIWNRYSQN